jgi:hypothetical protein
MTALPVSHLSTESNKTSHSNNSITAIFSYARIVYSTRK